MILLDTHVLLWLKEPAHRVGRTSWERIEDAKGRGELYVSVITFWEIGMLIRKRRAQLLLPAAEWRSELLLRGIQEISVDGMTAIQAGTLDGPDGDPADRIIVTTAMRRGLTLITADRRILAWRGPLKIMDARL